MYSRRKNPSQEMQGKDGTQSKKIKLNEEVEDKEVVINDSTEEASGSTRTPRGRTQMHCLSIKRARGEVQTVEFNALGQPVGPAATNMQSYIGVLARERVKITYSTWKHVPEEVKEKIWETVNMSFNVPKGWRAECLKSANNKWRQFKTLLTNAYVYARCDSPELMNIPPVEYPFILKSDWTAFCLTRLADRFRMQRESQKQRRAQNIYPHRLARKGYAKFADENPTLVCDDPDITQATLWMEVRKKKDGQYDGDGLQEKVTKIDDLKGTILDTVLEKDEHGGFLRGVGGHVDRSSYKRFGTTNQLYVDQQNEITSMKMRIAKLEAALSLSRGGADLSISKGSCSVLQPELEPTQESRSPDHVEDQPIAISPDRVCTIDANTHMGKLVELLLDSSIVAYGTVVKFDGTNDNYLKVTIDEVLDEYANLPAPNDESRSINDCVGSHVLWPTHLLNLRDEKTSRNANKEREQSDIDLSGVPAPLGLVYHYCAARNTVRMKLDAEVYGHEQKLFVGLKDIKPFCQLHSIPYTCIGVYLKFLFKKLQQSQKTEKYMFVDPSSIGHIAYRSTDKKFLEEKRQMRCQALAERLNHASRNQWALVPVNVGEHWVLTVIDPFNDEDAMLDPLFKGNRNVAWKQCVEDSLKIHAAFKERRPQKSVHGK